MASEDIFLNKATENAGSITRLPDGVGGEATPVDFDEPVEADHEGDPEEG